MPEPFVRLHLPNLDELGVDWPDVRGLTIEYEKLQAEHVKASAALDELLSARPAAIERDRLAYATAIRDGKDDPGEAALAKLHAKIAGAARKAEAIAVATRAVAADIADLVARRREELLRDTDRAVTEDRQLLREAVDGWEVARERLYAHEALRGWVREFPERTKFLPGASPGFRALVGPNGDPVTASELVQALRADAEPPVAEPVA